MEGAWQTLLLKKPAFSETKSASTGTRWPEEWLPAAVPPLSAAAWWPRLCPYLLPDLSPALAAGLRVFLGENMSRTQPAERYHLYLPLPPCCEPPVNDQRTGRISPSDTSTGFGATTLSKDAFKEAQPRG